MCVCVESVVLISWGLYRVVLRIPGGCQAGTDSHSSLQPGHCPTPGCSGEQNLGDSGEQPVTRTVRHRTPARRVAKSTHRTLSHTPFGDTLFGFGHEGSWT